MIIQKIYNIQENMPRNLVDVSENLFFCPSSRLRINNFLNETKKIINEQSKVPYLFPYKIELIYNSEKNGGRINSSLCYEKGYQKMITNDLVTVHFDSRKSIGVLRKNETPLVIIKTNSGKVEKKILSL